MGFPELLIPLGAFALTGWVVYTVANGLRRWHQQRMLSQFQTKLLDRIGSVNELGAFLNTEAGERFLKGLTTINEAKRGPHARILEAVQGGGVLVTMASALYLYGWLTPPSRPSEMVDGVNFIATILFGVGAGLLGSAAVSYRLSKRMGLFPDNEPQRRKSSTSAL